MACLPRCESPSPTNVQRAPAAMIDVCALLASPSWARWSCYFHTPTTLHRMDRTFTAHQIVHSSRRTKCKSYIIILMAPRRLARCTIVVDACFATIVKTIGSWSARRLPHSLPRPSPRWTKHSWTRRCRRSDRARTTPPARWAQEPAGHARAPPPSRALLRTTSY